jgi:azurin
MKTLKHFSLILTLLVLPFAAMAADTGNPGTDETIRTVEIKGTDQMKFDVTEITAVPGEKIRIVLTTVSKIPKIAMAHNVVILNKGTDVTAFANASAMARDNLYIAPEYKDEVIAATDLAGGGETVEVIFTVPQSEGAYTFICSFPGHYMAGMKGTLVVKSPTS